MSQNWTPPPASGGGAATVPNYLVPAIISIFCCWPLAIPAIIFATQVNSKLAAGDTAGFLECGQRDWLAGEEGFGAREADHRRRHAAVRDACGVDVAVGRT